MVAVVTCMALTVAIGAMIAFVWVVVLAKRGNTTTFSRLGRNNFWMFVFRATLVLAVIGVWISAIVLLFSVAWYVALAVATVVQVAAAVALSLRKKLPSDTPGR